MKQTLKSDAIIQTLEVLHQRISERFPESGLGKVARELTETARTVALDTRRLRRPNYLLRLLLLIVLIGVATQASVLFELEMGADFDWPDALTVTTGLEAAANLLILAGAAIWYLVSLEERIKRDAALRGLHELRSFAHVIDMHQLTKDPTMTGEQAMMTSSSPKRDMTPFLLSRYLDYCSEMLALTGKLAALYGEETQDTKITSAVNEIEALTTNLGRKIWQKIMIIHNNEASGGSPLSRSAG